MLTTEGFYIIIEHSVHGERARPTLNRTSWALQCSAKGPPVSRILSLAAESERREAGGKVAAPGPMTEADDGGREAHPPSELCFSLQPEEPVGMNKVDDREGLQYYHTHVYLSDFQTHTNPQ